MTKKRRAVKALGSIFFLISYIFTRTQVNYLNALQANHYRNHLPEQVRLSLRRQVETLGEAHRTLNALNITLPNSNDNDVILFIQGLHFGQAFEWFRPFTLLMGKPVHAYFHKIFHHGEWVLQKTFLKNSIDRVLQVHPNSKITIVGYSAGGALMLDLLADIGQRPKYQQIKWHSVAATISGYGPPGIASIPLNIIFGGFTRTIAYGLQERLNGLQLNNCQHHVTTNCELDIHACRVSEFHSPQLLPNMPCGNQATGLLSRSKSPSNS